jgi:hypothetical protein
LSVQSAENEIWSVTSDTPLEQPGVTLPKIGERSVARREDVMAGWEKMVGNVMTLANRTDAASPSSSLKLTELTVELGFTAKGTAFIAEAGVAASITLTFNRPAPWVPPGGISPAEFTLSGSNRTVRQARRRSAA